MVQKAMGQQCTQVIVNFVLDTVFLIFSRRVNLFLILPCFLKQDKGESPNITESCLNDDSTMELDCNETMLTVSKTLCFCLLLLVACCHYLYPY